MIDLFDSMASNRYMLGRGELILHNLTHFPCDNQQLLPWLITIVFNLWQCKTHIMIATLEGITCWLNVCFHLSPTEACLSDMHIIIGVLP